MGAYKMRQGVSINLGLAINRPTKPEPTVYKRASDAVVKSHNWLMATLHAITKPFVKMAQNYRGRGQR